MDARLELAALVDAWQRRESLRSEDPCPEEFHTAQSNTIFFQRIICVVGPRFSVGKPLLWISWQIQILRDHHRE